MRITSIKESGTNNILRWAISLHADIRSDMQIQSLINDETFYHVQVEDVNFFELFRLTQMYREKIRVIAEKKADIPLRKELLQLFPGEFIQDPENSPDEKLPLYELVEHGTQNFMNIAMQMNADSDIIRPETVRLFLPMICRKFDIQFPLGFMDFVSMIRTEEAANAIFTQEYPETLNSINIDSSDICNMILLGLMKSTSIIRYDQHYDKLLNIIKYAPLNKVNSDHLYKFRMSSFFKYDPISRGEVRCGMFFPDKASIAKNMKHLATINSPMKVEFEVQLPIQYMQMILNSFSREELNVIHESSMSSIIDAGINLNDFKTEEFDESASEEDQAKITEYNNSIEAYRTRINEANQTVLNTIPILLNNPGDVDITSTFAMLPSIYCTKATFIVDTKYANMYTNHYDPLISEMFSEMMEVCNSLNAQISNSK